MLGFEDFWVGIVWFATMLAPIFCIAYGAVMLNRGGEEE